MITNRLNPVYVNRVREPWEQGGGVSSDPPLFDPTGPTLDLIFVLNEYYEYEYGPLDPSLNLDFVNQSYGSE